MATQHTPLNPATIRRISELIGDTATGLTGREIARLLAECKLPDPGEITKRDRLDEALMGAQRRDRAANGVFKFVNTVMSPVRFLDDDELFAEWQAALSSALAFEGYEISEKGRVRRRGSTASTISEARVRADRFRAKLRERGVHDAVLRACADEIRDENYFHSVFEAAKSLASRIRGLTDLTGDGVALVDEALGRKRGLPRLAFNGLVDRTDQSEHDGNANLLRGVFGAFRNTTGHRPKVEWAIPEQDALDMLSTISFLHRRLDAATVVPEHLRAQAA